MSTVVLIVISSLLTATTGRLLRGPRNTVVVSGTMATLTCATDLTIDRLCWDRYVRDTDKKLKWITLCTTSGCRSRYSHTSADMRFRQHSLTIDSCNATDSGRYRCEVCDSRDTKQTARLAVIGELLTLLFERNVWNFRLAYSRSFRYVRY